MYLARWPNDALTEIHACPATVMWADATPRSKRAAAKVQIDPTRASNEEPTTPISDEMITSRSRPASSHRPTKNVLNPDASATPRRSARVAVDESNATASVGRKNGSQRSEVFTVALAEMSFASSDRPISTPRRYRVGFAPEAAGQTRPNGTILLGLLLSSSPEPRS